MNERDRNCLWEFIRGDWPSPQFESWLYAHRGLEQSLGDTLYFDVISADYTSADAVRLVKRALREILEVQLACECITLSNLAVVDMGHQSEHVFKSLEQNAVRGDPYWWLSLYQCSKCAQWWLVAQEERQNDLFVMRRMSPEDAEAAKSRDRWPTDLDNYEDLLRIGLRAGRSVRFFDPLDSSLVWTAADIARKRPGIRLSEVASLLSLDPDTAKLIASKVKQTEGIEIDPR